MEENIQVMTKYTMGAQMDIHHLNIDAAAGKTREAKFTKSRDRVINFCRSKHQHLM